MSVTRKIIDFYVEAERKTTLIKELGKTYFLIPYNVLIIVPFIFTVVNKVIIEKCASDPITWPVIMKSR